MNNSIIIGLVLGTIFGFIGYFATDSFLISLIVAGMTILYFSFVINRRFNKYLVMTKRFHSCYFFINNFIVSLSVKESIVDAFSSSSEGLGRSFLDSQDGIEDLTENEKIIYLKKYFDFHIYYLFSDIIALWCEQGGDIIKMSNYLMGSCRESEEYILYCQSENRKSGIEFCLLWVFSLFILTILRVVLADFYSSITRQVFYPYAIFGIFVILLFSIEILTRRMTNINIRGWYNETK
ncbi:MAG: hypothetical protein WCR34_03440 [Bacilli bacterium]